MSKGELFEQVDFRATSVAPAGSAFSANMPVDLRVEEINTALTQTIPANLNLAFNKVRPNYEYLRSMEPVPTLRIVREATLLDSNNLILPHERRVDSRRELILASLAQKGIACTQVFYELFDGELAEYAVVGRPIKGSDDISSLYGTLNQEDGSPDSYAFIDGSKEASNQHPLAIDRQAAIDFLAGLAARQNGQTPSEDELRLLQQLYLASPNREHFRERLFRVRNDKSGETVDIDAKLTNTVRGKQVLNSYWVAASFEFPSKDPVTMTVKFDPPKRNNRLYPSANLTMAIMDHPNAPGSTPEERASSFNTILTLYRDRPEEFFGVIDNAVKWLANSEPTDK